MSIKRNSCRVTERVTMKKLFAMGVSVKDISTKLRVMEPVISDVIEGNWDKKEKALTLAAMEANTIKLQGKADEDANRIAQIAAAAAAAIQGHAPVVDREALRKQIEVEIRAEIAAEATPSIVETVAKLGGDELSPQQRGALTRKANAEKEADADAQAA